MAYLCEEICDTFCNDWAGEGCLGLSFCWARLGFEPGDLVSRPRLKLGEPSFSDSANFELVSLMTTC